MTACPPTTRALAKALARRTAFRKTLADTTAFEPSSWSKLAFRSTVLPRGQASLPVELGQVSRVVASTVLFDCQCPSLFIRLIANTFVRLIEGLFADMIVVWLYGCLFLVAC